VTRHFRNVDVWNASVSTAKDSIAVTSVKVMLTDREPSATSTRFPDQQQGLTIDTLATADANQAYLNQSNVQQVVSTLAVMTMNLFL